MSTDLGECQAIEMIRVTLAMRWAIIPNGVNFRFMFTSSFI